MSEKINSLSQAWAVIGPILVIRGETDYWRAVEQLNFLMETIGNDKHHPLSSLLETLTIVVEAYENQQVNIPSQIYGVEVLSHLMEEFELTPSDLAEVGSVEEIAEILAGQREFTVKQIKMLGTRFNVSPAVFV